MKRVVSALLVCVLLVGVVLSLGSCGKMLSGSYKNDLLGTYTFKGKKVTYSHKILTAEVSVEGTYKIEKKDDGMTITFDFGDEDAGENKSGVAHNFSEGEENGAKYIKIGLVKYTKQ